MRWSTSRKTDYKGHPTLLTVKITFASTYLHVWVYWQHLLILFIKNLKVITLCILCKNKDWIVLNMDAKKNPLIFFTLNGKTKNFHIFRRTNKYSVSKLMKATCHRQMMFLQIILCSTSSIRDLYKIQLWSKCSSTVHLLRLLGCQCATTSLSMKRSKIKLIWMHRNGVQWWWDDLYV